MDTLNEKHSSQKPVVLSVITAIAIAACFAMVAAWFALLVLEERRFVPVDRAASSSCGVCGVVERVRELEPAASQALEGSGAEGAILVLVALIGASTRNPRPPVSMKLP